ncbi:MAG: hypothetical protein HY680_06450, partial [Chloroflexi bacterium]|nr:hypothetical protein [Chloroflexota bacterium]
MRPQRLARGVRMGVTRPVDTVIARETPVTQLPGYVLRRAHVGEHEAGLLLDKGHAERVCATPGTHRVLVLDDLVPGILLDRRSFARVRASPFTVTLDHNGLPTADNECVLLQATLTVAVVDAARFVQTFGASATASQVAERLVEETWDRLQAKVLGYSQQDLCHSRQLAQEMAGFLTGPEGCLRHLETWGLRCVGITPVVCLPKRKLEAVLERLGEALAQRGILSPDEMDDLLEDLPEGEDAKRALAEVMDEFLEEQED